MTAKAAYPALPVSSAAHRVSDYALAGLPLARSAITEPLILRLALVEAFIAQSTPVSTLAPLGIPKGLSTVIALVYAAVQARRLAKREPKLFSVLLSTAWPLLRTLDELVDSARPVRRQLASYWAIYALLNVAERTRIRTGVTADVTSGSWTRLRQTIEALKSRLPRIASRQRFPEPRPMDLSRVADGLGKRKNLLEAMLGSRWRTMRTIFLLWAMSSNFINAALVIDWLLQPLRTIRRLRSDADSAAKGVRREVRIVEVDTPAQPANIESLPTPAPSSPPTPQVEVDSAPSTPRRRPVQSPLERTTSSLQLDDGWTTEEEVREVELRTLTL